MSSPWIQHVKAYASKHRMTFGEAMKESRDSYEPKRQDEVSRRGALRPRKPRRGSDHKRM